MYAIFIAHLRNVAFKIDKFIVKRNTATYVQPKCPGLCFYLHICIWYGWKICFGSADIKRITSNGIQKYYFELTSLDSLLLSKLSRSEGQRVFKQLNV